jgi:hypothetical protein
MMPSACAQVADGLEQRRHHQRRRSVRIAQRAAHQPGFLLQHQHFEKIAHRLGMADDGMADRLTPDQRAHAPRHGENGEFALGLGRIAQDAAPQARGSASTRSSSACLPASSSAE